VEVTRTIYKSAAGNKPVKLPLEKDDPFYSFKGRFTGTLADGPLRYSGGHRLKIG